MHKLTLSPNYILMRYMEQGYSIPDELENMECPYITGAEIDENGNVVIHIEDRPEAVGEATHAVIRFE